MAMCHRSERVLLAGMGAESNRDLGPGTYMPLGKAADASSTFETPKRPAAAAFNVSAERDNIAGGGKFVTPGPGRYIDRDRPDASTLIQNSSSSSNFASNTIRFNPRALNPGQPGPGQYMATEGMGDKAKKVLAKSRASGDKPSVPGAQPSVSWKRMSTAPSIPAKHQSFGFRKSLDQGVVPLRKRGPKVDEDVNDGTTKGASKGADFSRSKTERFKAKKADAYLAQNYPDRSASQASSKSAPSRARAPREGPGYDETLARKKLEEAAAIPGPGTYAPPRSDFEKSTGSQNAGPFNGTAKRFKDKMDDLGELGPGEYSDGLQKATKAMKIKEPHAAALHNTPFGCTAGRFGKQSVVGQATSGATPGPGAYTKEDTGFLSQQQDRQFGRFEGGFGSGSERFQAASQAYSADVGPGAYEVNPDAEVSEKLGRRRHKGGLSCLDSSFPREKGISQSLNIVNAGNQPAPGDYEVDKGLGKMGPPGREEVAHVQETPFGITVKRWGDGKTKSRINNFAPPGPGTYDAITAKTALEPRGRDGKPVERQVSFGISAERFHRRAPGEGRRTKMPGPGEYTDGVKAATTKWRTPTFNVSIKRTEAEAKIVEVL